MCSLFLLFLYDQIQQSEPFLCDDDASVGFCDCMKMNPGGGEIYSCGGYNLTEIPTEFAVTVSSLTILFTNINRLTNDDLSNYIELEDIILSVNRITDLSSDVFKYNAKLMHLDLSRNYIESLPEDLFVHNLQLAQIILVGNKIKSFNSNMLANNTALHVINLSNNPIISLNLKGNILTLSCLNCFDCTCMDSSSWEWIKQKYDNFDLSCRDGKEINSDLIAVDCLNNSHVTLYSKGTEIAGLTCQCFDITSIRNKLITSSTENTENLLYGQTITLRTSSIDNDNVQNHFSTENMTKTNTKSDDHLSSPLDTDTTINDILQGAITAILSGIAGFIAGSFTIVSILILIKRKYDEKLHQEQRIRHEETNTLVLDSINIIQSWDTEDIGETVGHIFLNIPPRNHEILTTEDSIGCVTLYNAVGRI